MSRQLEHISQKAKYPRSEDILRDKIALYRRLGTVSREYKKTQLEHLLGPFFNNNTDGVSGNTYQQNYVPGMRPPPNVTYATPGYDTSLYNQQPPPTPPAPQQQLPPPPQQQQPVPYVAPKVGPKIPSSVPSTAPVTPPNVTKQQSIATQRSIFSTGLSKLANLMNIGSSQKATKVVQDTQPLDSSIKTAPEPTDTTIVKSVVQEETKPMTNEELDAAFLSIQKNDPAITQELYHKLLVYLSTLDQFKDMKENDVKAVALDMLRQQGDKALTDTSKQSPIPVIQPKDELVKRILENVDIDTGTFKGGVGRLVADDTYQIDYVIPSKSIIDPVTQQKITDGVSNVQFKVNDDSTITMTINKKSGDSSTVDLLPEEFDGMIYTLQGPSTYRVARFIASIAKRMAPSQSSQPADDGTIERPASERTPIPKGTRQKKPKKSTVPLETPSKTDILDVIPTGDLTQTIEQSVDNDDSSREIDIEEYIEPFRNVYNNAFRITADNEPVYSINDEYDIIFTADTDTNIVRRWYSAHGGSDNRPEVTYRPTDRPTRRSKTNRVRAIMLVPDDGANNVRFEVHMNNTDVLSVPATKQLMDLFYSTTPESNQRLLDLIPTLHYRVMIGRGISAKNRPKRKGIKRVRKKKKKDDIKGGALIITDSDDAYKQLYKILGSLEAGNYTDDMVSEAGRINDYLFEQGLFDKTEHNGVSKVLDKHIRDRP